MRASEVKQIIEVRSDSLALSDGVLADVLLQLLRDRVHGGGRGRPSVRHGPPVVEQLLLHATDALVAHLGEEVERVGGQLRRVGARGGVVREEGLGDRCGNSKTQMWRDGAPTYENRVSTGATMTSA